MKLIFSDPTPRWVPFVAAILVVGGMLISGWWTGYDPGVTLKVCAALAALFLVLIVLHGRLILERPDRAAERRRHALRGQDSDVGRAWASRVVCRHRG